MKTKTGLVFAFVMLVGAAARAESDTSTESAGFAPGGSAEGGAASAFGAPGQIVLTMGARTGEHLLYRKQGPGWQFQLQPAMDYFLTSRFSVGGILGYRHATGGTGTGANASGTDTFTVGARGGATFAINPLFGLWPTVGLYLDRTAFNHSSTTDTWFALAVPVLFHPASHFFAALGPSYEINLSGPAANQLGVDTMLGGWF